MQKKAVTLYRSAAEELLLRAVHIELTSSASRPGQFDVTFHSKRSIRQVLKSLSNARHLGAERFQATDIASWGLSTLPAGTWARNMTAARKLSRRAGSKEASTATRGKTRRWSCCARPSCSPPAGSPLSTVSRRSSSRAARRAKANQACTRCRAPSATPPRSRKRCRHQGVGWLDLENIFMWALPSMCYAILLCAFRGPGYSQQQPLAAVAASWHRPC